MSSGISADAATQQLAQETASYQERYRSVMSTQSPAPAKTQNMKVAVTLGQMMASQAPEPGRLLGMLGTALNQAPQVALSQLHWHAGQPAARDTGSLAAQQRASLQGGSAQAAFPSRRRRRCAWKRTWPCRTMTTAPPWPPSRPSRKPWRASRACR
ncbi:hypothetical protein BA896_015265 [Janthinobacterium lividum]|uniref:Uncharacterized protein n=1 Tax=Janthinobacterium lividum TaxID=29581 RepID=A0A1E8PLJ4_9BURK|nr:hypothetical protein BA896_015265 [Janthinobacterium lividum]